MVGGLVAEWYRADGAEVAPGEPVCRLECDFIAFEIEAEGAGVLRHRRPAGSIERKGAILGVIVSRGEGLPPDEELRALEARATAAIEAPAAPAGRGAAALEQAPAVPGTHRGAAAAGADDLAEPGPAAVVVPFPARGARAEAGADGHAVPLAEPGGAIPGLPLWEEGEATARADAEAAMGRQDGAMQPEPASRLARIADEAAATAEVLSAHVCVSWARAREAAAALSDEWHPFGPKPTVEDLAVRAIARALAEAGLNAGPAGVVVVEPDADRSFAVENPLDEEFRRMVQARADGGGSFERAEWVVVSLMPLGVERLEPRLSGGRLAFGLGAGPEGQGTITMRYDSMLFGEGEAGRVLARVRSLVENPYRLWG